MKKLLSVVLAVAMLVSVMACTVSLQVSAATDLCLYQGLLADAEGNAVTSGAGDNYTWEYADNVLTITTTGDANIDLWQTTAFTVATDKGFVLNYVSEIPMAISLGVTTKSGTGWPSLGSDFFNSLGYADGDLITATINSESVKCVPAGSKSAILNLNGYFTWDPANDQTPASGASAVTLCNIKLQGAGKVQFYAMSVVDQEPTTAEEVKVGGAEGYLASAASTGGTTAAGTDNTTAAQGGTAATTAANGTSANTGEESNVLLFVAIAAVAVGVIAVTAIASKKAKSK